MQANWLLRVALLGLCVTIDGVPASAHGKGATADSALVKKDGSVTVAGFTIPESSLLAEQTRDALRIARELKNNAGPAKEDCPSIEGAARVDIPAIRRCQATAFYKTPFYRKMLQRYAVEISATEIGGIYSEVFMPATGVAPQNQKRVLINLHGGGFQLGSRTLSRLESIPIAAVGRIKVISIDYRMAPEYSFPAASEDVAAVYQELLKSYHPDSIGIYGCSAGGVLTAETVAWLRKEGLPAPGAVGMFCGAAAYWTEGDSGYIGAAFAGTAATAPREDPYFRYFKDSDPDDPLVFPLRSPRVLASFPPSLLITSTRDVALSSVVRTHAALVEEGVEAELHVFEGLGHAFIFDADLPESRDVYDITVRFFDRHLGDR